MSDSYINSKYNFTLSGVNFTAEIDDSLSAEYRAKKYPPASKKTLHSHPLHELFFVFDDGIKINLENEVLEYKNCIISFPPNTKHFTERISDYRLLFSCSIKEKNGDKLADFFLKKFTSNDICCIPVIKPEINVTIMGKAILKNLETLPGL